MQRSYELVVFGATGFTGQYISQHVTTHLPTDLKWAIAGRSRSKLEAVRSELQQLNKDRLLPEIEECSLDKSQLSALAAKTKVLITGVGPYAIYGTPVVEACIENGTHYIDVTGESPWVLDMIEKHDAQAKAKQTIVVPQIGIDSAPADLLTWSLATYARRTLNTGLTELDHTIYEWKGGPSGGTLASVLNLFESYPLDKVMAATKPWAQSPIGRPESSRNDPPKGALEKYLGVRTIRDLGVQTTSLQGPIDAAEVYRSWGLIDGGKYYGDKFRFRPYATVRNLLTGVFVHFAIAFSSILLLLPPFRTLMKRFVLQPGQGPSRESSRHDRIEYRAIATADTSDPADPKRVFGKLVFEGSLYHLTGVFAAEAAITLLRDETLAHKMGGGFLTPATLGEAYIDRLQKAGVRFEVRMMP